MKCSQEEPRIVSRLTFVGLIVSRRALLAIAGLGVIWPGALVRELSAPPVIVMFYGERLGERIALTAEQDISGFMRGIQESASLGPEQVSSRPYIDVALYWNFWLYGAYARDPNGIAKLDPKTATRRARYYPEHRGNDPVFVYNAPFPGDSRQFRKVKTPATAVLTARRIPTSLR